jgi:hypothetical protein
MNVNEFRFIVLGNKLSKISFILNFGSYKRRQIYDVASKTDNAENVRIKS